MKTKLLLSFFIILFLSSISFSQTKKGYININYGSSIPLDPFGKKDLDDVASGFAKVGQAIEISGNYLIVKNIGAALSIRGQINPLDNSSIETGYTTNYPNTTFAVNTTNGWRMITSMIGVYQSLPILSKKITCDLKVMAGILTIWYPEMIINNYSGNLALWNNWFIQNEDKANSIAYSVSTTFRFAIIRNVFLSADISYWGGKPKFNFTRNYYNGTIINNVYEQRINSVNISLGLGIQL